MELTKTSCQKIRWIRAVPHGVGQEPRSNVYPIFGTLVLLPGHCFPARISAWITAGHSGHQEHGPIFRYFVNLVIPEPILRIQYRTLRNHFGQRFLAVLLKPHQVNHRLMSAHQDPVRTPGCSAYSYRVLPGILPAVNFQARPFSFLLRETHFSWHLRWASRCWLYLTILNPCIDQPDPCIGCKAKVWFQPGILHTGTINSMQLIKGDFRISSRL